MEPSSAPEAGELLLRHHLGLEREGAKGLAENGISLPSQSWNPGQPEDKDFLFVCF